MQPSPDSQPGRSLVVATLAALTLLFWIQAARTYAVFNATIDEPRHIAASVEIYQTGDFRYFFTSPLPRYFMGLGPFLDGVRLPTLDDPALEPYFEAVRGHRDSAVGRFVLEHGDRYWRTLSLARLGTLAFAPLLLWVTFRWTAHIFDRRAGLAAAALVGLSPNLLAHGALATTDLATAALLTIAAYTLWRWVERRDRRTAAVAGVAGAVACAAKMPVIAMLVLIGGAFLLLPTAEGRSALRSRTGLRELALQLVILMGCGFVTLWAIYQFDVATLTERRLAARVGVPEAGSRIDTIDRLTSPGGTLNETLHQLSETVPVPMPAFFDGLSIISTHSGLAWRSFLLGEISNEGFWYYYPAAFVLKATLPFVLLIGLGIAAVLWRPGGETRRRLLFPLGATAAVLLLPSFATSNIGVRHVLILFPLLAIPAGGLFTARLPSTRTLQVVALGLLVWHAAESWLAHPDYLPYFNQIGRDRAPEILLDSNLDWGQDLARLARHADEQDIDTITLSVFGARYGTGPEVLGLDGVRYLETGERPHGWFAVSYNHLAGIGIPHSTYAAQEGFRWLADHRPRARIGRSILLYRLP